MARSRRSTLLRLVTPLRRYSCHACNHTFLGVRHKSEASRIMINIASHTLLRWQAVCPRCHSSNVRRTAAGNVFGGLWVRFWRLLHIPAYRCNGCRQQFFALRAPAPHDAEEHVQA